MNAFRFFEDPGSRYTKWFSFENPDGKKGAGGKAHMGMKGAPNSTMKPGGSVVLAHHEGGAGIINVIWLAEDAFNKPEGIGAMWIDIYWDGSEKPAVSAPIEDFFCHALSGHKKPFENWMFSSPEGRSFNCFAPMPFKDNCRVVLTNRSEMKITVFYCVQMTCGVELPEDFLYFHCLYREMRRTELLKDYEIIPGIEGRGRYMGANVQMYAGEGYDGTWFGEGEVKIYLDGDNEYPTLVGTGTEDYILTAWGQDEFSTMNAGCTLLEKDEAGRTRTAFYRIHASDPVYFTENCRVTLQQIGGAAPDIVQKAVERGAPVKLVCSTMKTGVDDTLWLDDAVTDHPDCIWVNFMREDYVGSAAYFYLNRPAL